jgi:hypothetical protein
MLQAPDPKSASPETLETSGLPVAMDAASRPPIQSQSCLTAVVSNSAPYSRLCEKVYEWAIENVDALAGQELFCDTRRGI